MDLWIRSQNREKLINCNDITLREKDTELTFDEIINYNINNPKIWECEIVGYFDKNTEFEILGKYNSKKRALEVLDYIEEHVGFLNVEMGAGRFGELDFQTDIVYQMPKE